jgi:hypothetical protein
MQPRTRLTSESEPFRHQPPARARDSPARLPEAVGSIGALGDTHIPISALDLAGMTQWVRIIRGLGRRTHMMQGHALNYRAKRYSMTHTIFYCSLAVWFSSPAKHRSRYMAKICAARPGPSRPNAVAANLPPPLQINVAFMVAGHSGGNTIPRIRMARQQNRPARTQCG